MARCIAAHELLVKQAYVRRWRRSAVAVVAFYRAGFVCHGCTSNLRLVRPKWGSEALPRQRRTRALLKLFRWFLLALLSSLSLSCFERDKVKAKYIYSSIF